MGDEEAATLEGQFYEFSRLFDNKRDGTTITLYRSDFWMRQTKLLDDRKITMTDTGILFNKFSWFRTTLAEHAICGLIEYIPIGFEGKAYCNATFDSFLCWPPTPVGEIASQYCPPTRLSDTTHKAVRRCGEEGTWLGKHLNDTNPVGWTNFTPCFPPEVQTIFVKVFENEKLAQEKFDIAQNTRYMEIVGFTISLLALVVSLVIFSYYRSLRNNRTRIHKNLFAAMVLQVWIRLTLYIDQAIARTSLDQYDPNSKDTFTGIDNTPYLCESCYVLMEYANSVVFMWMFIEGLYLHNMTTARDLRECTSYVTFQVLAWGVPFVFTIIWATLTAMHYQNETLKTCWFGYNFNPLYWIIQGPRLAVILINLIFLLDIMRVLIGKLRRTKTTEIQKVRKAVRAALFLLPLLGITNLLNMTEVAVDSSAWKFALWSYTTHFLRSFQGFFIALIYCFLNAEVRTTIKKHYNNYMIMRRDPRKPRCVFIFGSNRYTGRTKVLEPESSWMQMTRIRLAQIVSKDNKDISDSDSEPSVFGPPCNCDRHQDDSSDNAPEGAQAVTVTIHAEVNVQPETDSP